MDYYNNDRIQPKLAGLSPNQYRLQTSQLGGGEFSICPRVPASMSDFNTPVSGIGFSRSICLTTLIF
ncbi:IS3 family transposase [Metabacillus lacus]|uniref:IS3 family transposase n=1 Tax=Metabacillus lacus TaxID=1983721 RepID=UPI003CCD97CE